MKVIHIVPGSGDTFYCENCLRDGALVKELKRQGHDILMVPMYLPLFLDNPDLPGDTPVFFGGINVYLQQTLGIFRKTPRWIDKLFDSTRLLKWAAGKSGSTRANDLGALTLSMLKGEQGKQVKELNRLLTWLEEQEKPDLVHISNILLAGIADAVKQRLKVPVTCTLQDEDCWIDAMDPPYREQCWDAIREKSQSIDKFIAVSGYFAELMRDKIGLTKDKIEIIPVGIDFSGFRQSELPSDPPVIGYMARMSESMGLGRLVDAFIELKKESGFSNAKLKICGGETAEDRDYTSSLKAELEKAGLRDDAEFLADFDRSARIDFLASLTVLCVPTPTGTAFGTYIIEAMGAGVPVIEPDLGAFSELLDKTGGGILYAPDSSLADAMKSLLSDRDKLKDLASKGKESVYSEFSIDKTTEKLSDCYQTLI